MPDDTITLVSTTDSPEDVQAALGAPPAEKPAETPAEPPAETSAPPETPSEPPADETPEERETRETSEAGRRLSQASHLSRRKQSIQADIDDLTRMKMQARMDVEAEQARLAQLRYQHEQLAPPSPPTDTPPAPPAVSGAPAGQPAEGRSEPKLDDLDDKGSAKYANYEEYLSDHAKWIREEAVLAARKIVEEERFAERARIEHDSASRVVNEHLTKYNADLDEFKKTHADFDAVFEEAKAEVQEALVALGPQALKVIDGYTVFDAEDGPALSYYLLKHPDELKAIAMKAPHQQLVHLARLDTRLRTGAAKPGPSPVAAPITKAPEPIKPVGSGPTATTVPLDEASYQDFKLQRERDIRARRAG